MNVGKTLGLLTLVGLLTSGTAFAATPGGTAKARGDYGSIWQNQTASGTYARRSTRGSYVRRAPATYAAPMVATTTTPTTGTTAPQAVAQAPSEGRRFSYDPATSAGATGTASAANAAPTTVHRVYTNRGNANYRRSTVEQWQLPKTDANKIGG